MSKEFVARLVYLSDIFEVLNNFNLSFQGSNGTSSEFISKLKAFVRKLALWIENLKNKADNVQILTSIEDKPNDKISEEIVCHFSQLKKELMHYFPDHISSTYSINPFFVDPAGLTVGTEKQEELIDIQTDEAAKTKHNECACSINFWLSMESSYPNLATHAVPQLLIFLSTWECKQGFSALMSIKSKRRNGLAAPGHDFRCALNKVVPRIDQLAGKSNYFLLMKTIMMFSVIF